MAKLKTQQEKLLTLEITRRTMDYMMGLNEENEPGIRKKVKKYSRKMVRLYTGVIKDQHKKWLKSKKKKDQKALPWYGQAMADQRENNSVTLSIKDIEMPASIAS